MMHLISLPAGGFAFTGKVPADLAFVYEDPKDLDIAAHSGPGIAERIAKREGRIFKSRSWPDRAAAEAAALALAGSPEELAKHYAADPQ